MTHTPGEWLIKDKGSSQLIHNGIIEIAETKNMNDARLISVAPNLLEGLRWSVGEFKKSKESYWTTIEIFEKIIAKAEGRSS